MEIMLRFLAMNSIYGAIVLAVVLVLRLVLRRAPKVFSYMLWAVVFFRLLCPLSLSTEVSIIPDLSRVLDEESRYIGTETADTYSPSKLTAYAEIESDAEVYTESAVSSSAEYAVAEEKPAEGNCLSAESVIFILWASGCAVMLGCNLLSWVKMKKRVRTATRIDGRVYESDRIGTAFVSGVLRPRIYVPCGMEENQYRCVLSHEKTHIRRGDHIIKPVACLICCVYWFNPLVWLSMSLMCRDMEQSCDEAVIASMGSEIKGDYSRMLLVLGMKRPIAFKPAFGTGNAKKRIKNVLSYRKSGKAAIALSLVAVMLASAACIGSNSENKAVTEDNEAVISATEPENVIVQEETTAETVTETEEKKPTVNYMIPELGEPNIIVTTNAELGSYINGFSHKADGQIYIDMGDGEIVPYTGAVQVKSDSIKIYCDGEIRWISLSKMKLTSVDVSNCPTLENFYCNDNELTSIDISNNPALNEFDCSNNRIRSLDLSSNPNLKSVCCESNELTELRTGDLKMLESLYCSKNNLKSVDVSGCENLKYFGCSSNMLRTLNISSNTKLQKLQCYGNMIENIDASNNPMLEVFEYDQNTAVIN